MTKSEFNILVANSFGDNAVEVRRTTEEEALYLVLDHTLERKLQAAIVIRTSADGFEVRGTHFTSAEVIDAINFARFIWQAERFGVTAPLMHPW